jgi:ATP synthase protein I
MNEPGQGDEQFLQEVERQVRRTQKARNMTFWQGLAAVGAVGWMVVLPAVVGAFVGRWLDGRFVSGIFWTLSLLVLGLLIGCATAWRHVRKELG